MQSRSGIPLGVCVLPLPRRNAGRSVQYGNYIHEILGHAGVCYDTVALEELEQALPSLRLLVTVGETALPESLRNALRDWVEAGGAWLGIGGLCDLGELFGVQVVAPSYSSWGGGVCSLGEGYLAPKDPFWGDDADSLPLHFFGGLAVQATTGEVIAKVWNAHMHPTKRAGVVDHKFGKGYCRFIAVDITGTIVRFQQGTAITRDGVPASDGTAPVADGWLKSDDGAVVDWVFDRQEMPNVPGLSGFLHPIADIWRGWALQSLFHLADAVGVALPALWLYPNRVPAIGHISHDTDGNTPAEAQGLLDALAEAGIHSTWCVIAPGYEPEIMHAIRDAGHELATHYDSVSEGCAWNQEEFTRQWKFLVELFEGKRPVSNKNHLLRWEGDEEFFQWCVQHGILLDQSKGASKTGEAGFNFGTCHPYVPVDREGVPLDILELATPTQDLCVFGPVELLEPLLSAAYRHHGVLHLLFHPAHIFKPGVKDAIVQSVQKARALGMTWHTGEEIALWERARRKAQWSDYQTTEHGASVTLNTPEPLPDATLLWLLPPDAPESDETMTCWGRRFRAVALQPGEPSAFTP